MKKENWLEPVTREDAEKFAHDSMNIKKITKLNEIEDFSYGKFFEIGGFTNEGIITKWGNPRIHIALPLGEYGPIDADEHHETSVDDLRKLFDDGEELINIYLAWVMLVAEKNAGRKIDGKTYLESFSNACERYIDLAKSAEIRAIESEADERKNCVSAFVNQIAPRQSAEDKQPSNN